MISPTGTRSWAIAGSGRSARTKQEATNNNTKQKGQAAAITTTATEAQPTGPGIEATDNPGSRALCGAIDLQNKEPTETAQQKVLEAPKQWEELKAPQRPKMMEQEK